MKDNLSDARSEMEELPSQQGGVYSIDAMVFIQKNKRFGCATFDELQGMYLDNIASQKTSHQCILLVTDMTLNHQ